MRKRLVRANSSSNFLKLLAPVRPVISWITTSGWAFVTACITAALSSPSATTGSAPSSRRTLVPSGLRVIPTTSCPAPTRTGTRRRPSAPLAPATNTFISVSGQQLAHV